LIKDMPVFTGTTVIKVRMITNGNGGACVQVFDPSAAQVPPELQDDAHGVQDAHGVDIKGVVVRLLFFGAPPAPPAVDPPHAPTVRGVAAPTGDVMQPPAGGRHHHTAPDGV
jgi:hypothetical protein